MEVVGVLLEVAEQSGVVVWYRRLLPYAVGLYVREQGIPPVLVMDCDVLLDEAAHAAVLAALLAWHRSLPGQTAWRVLDADLLASITGGPPHGGETGP